MAEILDNWSVQMKYNIIEGTEADYIVIEEILRFIDRVCVPKIRI